MQYMYENAEKFETDMDRVTTEMHMAFPEQQISTNSSCKHL